MRADLWEELCFHSWPVLAASIWGPCGMSGLACQASSKLGLALPPRVSTSACPPQWDALLGFSPDTALTSPQHPQSSHFQEICRFCLTTPGAPTLSLPVSNNFYFFLLHGSTVWILYISPAASGAQPKLRSGLAQVPSALRTPEQRQ